MTGEFSPDRNNIALANYVFGAGNFSSRLMTRIRSKVGRTYGISSQVAAERFFGAFTISTSTQNGQLALMVDAILEEFRDFCKNGITEDELEKAKRFAIGNMAFQLEGIGNVAEKLLWLRFYDYLNSFVEQFDQMINKITIDSVNASIKSLYSPEKLIVIAVGKKSEIADQLKKIGNFTPFHFRDKV
jgi:zinc protease